MDTSLSKLQEIVKDREAWHAAVYGHKESDTAYRLNNKAVNIPKKHQILQNLDPAFCSNTTCLKMSASLKLLWNPHCQCTLQKTKNSCQGFIQLFNEETNMVIKLVQKELEENGIAGM